MTGIAILLGFATLWNLNYWILVFSGGRVWDAKFMRFDLAVYKFALGVPSRVGLFPLCQHRLVVDILENCYAFLFLELAEKL